MFKICNFVFLVYPWTNVSTLTPNLKEWLYLPNYLIQPDSFKLLGITFIIFLFFSVHDVDSMSCNLDLNEYLCL